MGRKKTFRKKRKYKHTNNNNNNNNKNNNYNNCSIPKLRSRDNGE